MNIHKGGLILETPKRKDFVLEQVFGSSAFEKIVPIGRDISHVPVVYQGNENTCVSATLTFVRQFIDKDSVDLSHEWLAYISRTGRNGAKPSQVLEPARKHGILQQEYWNDLLWEKNFEDALKMSANYRLPSYFYVTDLSPSGIFHALTKSVLAIGVRDWKGVGPHFMCAYDVTEDGQGLLCANWWEKEKQDIQIVPFETVVVAIAFMPLPEGLEKKDARLSCFEMLKRKISFYFYNYANA